METINLIPTARREAHQRRRYLHRWGLGVAVYGCVLTSVWLGAHWLSGGPERAAADELQDLQRHTQQINEQLRELKPRLAEAHTTLAASRSVGSQPNWALLLNLLAGELGEDVMLTSFRLEPMNQSGIALDRMDEPTEQNHYRVRLAGLARSQSAASDYVLRLEQTQLFDKVTLIDTRKEPFRNSVAAGFRIECELTP